MSPEAIRERRKAMGLSQGALAAKLGVTQPWICQLESGSATAKLWLGLALDALEFEQGAAKTLGA